VRAAPGGHEAGPVSKGPVPGELEEMPGGPGQLVQVIPKRPGRVSPEMPIDPPPADAQDPIETFPLPHPVDNLRQCFLAFSSNDHIDPGVAVKDLPVIKGNMRPSPNGDRFSGETFHFLENFGSHGKVEGKRSDPHHRGSMQAQGRFQAGEGRPRELKVLKIHFAPRLLQPGSQVQKAQRHGETFDDWIRGIDKQNAHESIFRNWNFIKSLAKLLKEREFRHSGQAKRDPESRIFKRFWIPAFAGMTV